MPDFVALNTARTALQAARLRIDTAAHNVANVATPGYTRQRVDIVPSWPYNSPWGQIGTGVDVTGITRARDAFLDARARNASGSLAGLSAEADLLGRAEAIMAEPDEGITGRLSDLWAAFEELGMTPSSIGARTAAINALDDLVGRIRSIASGWDGLRADSAEQIKVRLNDVNKLSQAVADLNRAIVEASAGGVPNDLLDQRDTAVDELSRIIGANVLYQDDGTVRVSLNGMALVDGTTARALELQPDGTIMHPAGVPVVAGGEIGGHQKFIFQHLPALEDSLDEFVADLAAALNAQHEAGWVNDTQQGGPLLGFTAGAAARTLTLLVTDPSELAVSSDPGPPFPEFNGVNAQRIADLRSAMVAGGGATTLEGAMRALVVDLGAKTYAAAAAAETQWGLAVATESAREGAHGVSLDEELALMLEAQRAYEAAARVMTTVDEALDVLINRTGVVGR